MRKKKVKRSLALNILAMAISGLIGMMLSSSIISWFGWNNQYFFVISSFLFGWVLYYRFGNDIQRNLASLFVRGKKK